MFPPGLGTVPSGDFPRCRSKQGTESTNRHLGKSPEGAVPCLTPDRYRTTRSHHRNSSSSLPTANRFGTRTHVPNPQSQSFSQVRLGADGTRSSGFSRVPKGAPDTIHRAVAFQ
ncbi:UNVERIFIED_CONTAM: hypothetical protein Sradi_3239300 [Sesamum radiatum]|uniref:Uncharacterized protein n=1 Tax=Sesamum radiatum TaxID=300843 RepID=A0AAW2RIQ1_SESRA